MYINILAKPACEHIYSSQECMPQSLGTIYLLTEMLLFLLNFSIKISIPGSYCPTQGTWNILLPTSWFVMSVNGLLRVWFHQALSFRKQVLLSWWRNSPAFCETWRSTFAVVHPQILPGSSWIHSTPTHFVPLTSVYSIVPVSMHRPPEVSLPFLFIS